MSVETFGRLPDGRDVHLITVGQAPGIELRLLDLGATVQALHVTCGDGVRRNIVLGHATPEEYLTSAFYLGGTIGRYANRIAGGRFVLDGQQFAVGAHDRGNHLHGGPDGFDRRSWNVDRHDASTAVLSLVSPDGDQGFPGEVRVTATFSVDTDRVTLDLAATTSAPTLVNLTSHVYVNLGGDGSGTIDDHSLRVPADRYTPVDDTGIPHGDHAPVDDTPFDLRTATRLAAVIRAPHPQVVDAAGIDHNFVVDGSGLRPVATLVCPSTSTRLDLASDQPGLQVYTGNFLDGRERTTSGALLRQGDGIALEPQLFPDSPNHPEWPSAELRPGDTYRSTLTWTVLSVDR